MLLDSIKELRYINRISINISFTHEVSEDITVPLINIGQALNLPYIEIVGFKYFSYNPVYSEGALCSSNWRCNRTIFVLCTDSPQRPYLTLLCDCYFVSALSIIKFYFCHEPTAK